MSPARIALSLSVALHGFRVGLPVLPGITRVAGTPFLLAVAADLAVHGIGFNLVTVIIPPMPPLTVWAPTNDLVGMEPGGLEELPAITTAVIAHHSARSQGGSRSL